MSDWNAGIIEEFRANEGRVGGPFEGAPMVLLHHVGRKSGTERVTPLVYLPGMSSDELYVFASKAGAPTDPDWYRNLTAAGRATVEVGTETFEVEVAEVTGAERDALYAEQVTRMPGFAEYEEKTEGIRVIPVVHLTRV
ncbi:nitroreductase family deazaflavin-dependent oxidoreductase [Nocardioides nematodiphilus]|uniref:nitroreductase family deazaflavin-dependent oxidoreductase n=1 Tax=Nocardioides nematodiphilus TaxID=2849669 RepID=UPI001CDA338C|nr:nitroreductase family deazaflavin-dependent oxidoreductase [Nocardioides nematodiphilus]MCA1984625.1 nitroreductase family deazaflavin-dependent oxidoreductase [Nocardioides nematodiphilus]